MEGDLVERQGARRFRMLRCIGRGGFGEVWLASMRSPGGLETEVALKLLREEVGVDLRAVRRLRDEGRLLASVRHPAVAQVVDLTRLDGRIGLVTEYVDGDDLEHCAAPPDPIPPRPLVQAIGAVAAALAEAWSSEGPHGPLRLVHRDIKPSNVRIGRHGQVKLLDFGLARLADDERRPDSFGPTSDVLAGSVPYLAPERLGQRASLPAGDVFGLGCCLFEGLAGQRFHLDGSLPAVSAICLAPRRHAAHVEDRLSMLEAIGPALRALVAEMLRFDPAQRPDAAEVALRCETLREQLDGPSLRRWCADRAWSDRSFEGSLQGAVLTEDDLTLGDTAPEDASDVGPPRVPLIRRPLGTVDPQDDTPLLRAYPDSPLPIGVTLVEDLAGPVSLAPAPAAAPPRPARAAAAVGVAGCAGIAAVGGVVLLGVLAIAAWLGLR